MAKPDKSRTIFVCQNCGKESLKWLGRCPNCQEWNSFEETVVSAATPIPIADLSNPPRELSQIAIR